MNERLLRPLRRLAAALAGLRGRVRAAVAGEVARAVGEAVRDAVAAAIDGNPDDAPAPAPAPVARRWADDPDPWDDRPGWRDGGEDCEHEPDGFGPPAPVAPVPPGLICRTTAGPAAVSAGVAAGRWWLRRRGSVSEAAGVGVLVALAALAGGPLARAGATVVATAADLSAAADALGTGAARLGQL